MHPDLSPHLHTPKCNLLIEEFHKCHKENTFKRWIGACSDLDSKVIACCREERKEKIKENAIKAKERQERILKRMAEESA